MAAKKIPADILEMFAHKTTLLHKDRIPAAKSSVLPQYTIEPSGCWCPFRVRPLRNWTIFIIRFASPL